MGINLIHKTRVMNKGLIISILLLGISAVSLAQAIKLDKRSEASINLNMEDSRNYPNIKEAISELMKFENNESSQMFKPIVCINQDKGLGWQKV